MSSSWPPSVCVDASFVMRLLKEVDATGPASQCWDSWRRASRLIVAPALIYYELSNALFQYVKHKQLLIQEAQAALTLAQTLNITLYGDAELHRQALHLAQALSLPATYDAHYLALAQRLGAAFWTADRRLAQLVQPALPWVHLLE